MPQILLALDGKVDFIRKTNPWGSADEAAKEVLPEEPADPVGAMKAIVAIVERRQARANQGGKRK